MTNAATDQRRDDGAEQLTLLPAAPNVSARFRLNRATRERGLRHVAEIRRQLAEQAARADDNVHQLPPRHSEAA